MERRIGAGLARVDRIERLATDVFRQYRNDLSLAISNAPEESFVKALALVVSALRGGVQVWIAGNGGSAATAIHIASDLAANAPPGARLPTALTANLPQVTAVANDVAFTEVFATPVARFGSAGDLLVLLSVSGNSPNILRAAQVASAKEIGVVALTGGASPLNDCADVSVELGNSDFGVSEDLHLAFGHAAVRLLRGGQPNAVEGALCASL